MNRRLVRFPGALIFLALGQGMVFGQITVGGNGSDTIDSTAYSGNQTLTKLGINAVALTGNNTYSDGTVVNGGTLQLPSNAALGASGSSVTLNGGQLGLYGNDATLDSGRVITLGTAGGFLSAGWNKSFSINGSIVGSGNLGIGWDAGVIYLNGSNSYAGTTTIGTTANYSANSYALVRLGNANALPTGTSLVFGSSANTATLELSGYSVNVGSLTGASNARIANGGAGTPTMTINVASGSATYGGQINDSIAVTKTGAGTQVFTGANTYSGATFVNGGTLQVNSSGANFTPNNPNTTYTVNSGATLSMGSGSTAALWGRSVTLNNGTLFNAVSDYNDALSSLTMSGGSVAGNAYRVYDENTWQLSGNNTINTWIGYVTFGAPTGHTFNVTDGRTVMGGHISDFYAGGGPQFLQKSGNGTLVLTGANSYAGETRIQAGTLQVGNGGAGGTLGSGSIVNNGTLALNRSDNTIFGNSISGTGGVLKQGFGDVTFSAANSFSGGLTVEQGIAWVSGQNNLGSGTITLGNANTGTGGRSDAILLVSGSASTTITNNVVASAAATAGSLSLGGIGTGDGNFNLWTGTINLGKDLNLRAENTTTRSTFSGQITGAGGINVTRGRITLENTNNNYAGGTTVNAGTILQLSGNEVLPNATDLTVNGSLTLASGGGTETVGRLSGNGSVSALLPGSYTMAIAHSGSATFGGTISNGVGTVSLTKGGSGTQTLTANNTYTGNTTISGGTLIVASGGSISSSSVTTVGSGGNLRVNGTAGAVAVNGTLSGSGTVGAVTLNSGGTLAVGNSPGQMTAASAIWNAGSTFQFEITNATGVAGTDWDLFSVTGALDLTNIGSSNKMGLSVLSSGLQNYDVASEYSWLFARAASISGDQSWISGLDVTDRFVIESAGFNGGIQPNGKFRVLTGTDGGMATLSIKAVPEPSSASLLVVGIGGLLALRRRRKS